VNKADVEKAIEYISRNLTELLSERLVAKE
jgi:hypothetical protein